MCVQAEERDVMGALWGCLCVRDDRQALRVCIHSILKKAVPVYVRICDAVLIV